MSFAFGKGIFMLAASLRFLKRFKGLTIKYNQIKEIKK